MACRDNSIDLALFRRAQQYLRDVTQNCCDALRLEDWEHFYKACDSLIHRFATGFGARGTDLEDCSQEAWVELVRLLIDFDYDPARGEFRTWLYKIVRSATVNYFRRRTRHKTLQRQLCLLGGHDVAARASVETPMSDLTVDSILEHARGRLSPINYRLMVMRWLDGSSVDQVADALGLSREQVWYHEHRIRKSLRRTLRPGPEGGQSGAGRPALAGCS